MRLGVLIAAFVLLASAGYVDRAHTRSVTNRASADSWWCLHEQTRCTGFDTAAYHARWEVREKGYALGSGALGLAIVVLGRRRLRSR